MINKENLIGLCGILLAIFPQIAFYGSSFPLTLRLVVCFALAFVGARVFADRKVLAHKLDCKLRGLQCNCK